MTRDRPQLDESGDLLQVANDGRLTLSLPRLSKGKHRLTVKYAGSSTVGAAKRTFTVTSR